MTGPCEAPTLRWYRGRAQIIDVPFRCQGYPTRSPSRARSAKWHQAVDHVNCCQHRLTVFDQCQRALTTRFTLTLFGHSLGMSIGSSLFLTAVGAILYFAVDADISGLEISTIGVILMVIGVIGLLISLFFLGSWRERRRAPADRVVVRDREYY
jgi:hypothetical protein